MVDAFMLPNRRRQDRETVLFKTFLRVGGVAVNCDVLDIGPGGVRVQAALQAAAQTPVVLVVEQLGDFKARIAWSRDGEVGLRFDESAERIGQALELIALYGQTQS